MTKMEMKLSTANTDFQRYRESVMENINSSFGAVITDGKKHLGNSAITLNENFGSRKNL